MQSVKIGLRLGGWIMLISFSVSNFLSFGIENDDTCIHMENGNVRGKSEQLIVSGGLKLLRLSAIYGANSAGKSNLVHAFDFSRRLILEGIPNGCLYKYNRNDSDNKFKNTKFSYTIKISNSIYKYDVELILNKKMIRKESLFKINSKGEENIIFIRDLEGESKLEFKGGGSDFQNTIKMMFEVYKNDDERLLLIEVNRNKSLSLNGNIKSNPFSDVYNWFRFGLDITYPDTPCSDGFSHLQSSEKLGKIKHYMGRLGFDIEKIELADENPDNLFSNMPTKLVEDIKDGLEKAKLINNKLKENNTENPGISVRGEKTFYIFILDDDDEIIAKSIKFNYGDNKTFDLSEESDGTRRILDLLQILISNRENITYVVDELERSLHSSLTRKFIQIYLEESYKKNVQLIITTHEPKLLNLDILRKDSIWFANKIEGNTTLTSLDQFKVRQDVNIEKAYFDGRFNGVPKIGDII